VTFGPPPDMDANQCQSIRAYVGPIEGGTCDGAKLVVTAWRPNARELAELVAGKPLFLSFVGGLPPHFATVSFDEAIRPA